MPNPAPLPAPSSGASLQAAVIAALTADARLADALHGAKIYDTPPSAAAMPYVAIGQSTERDWSTGGDEGREHTLSLLVWSRARDRGEAHDLMGHLRRVLHDSALALDGWHLVALRHELSEVRRDSDGESWRGLVRFRAVTEPILA